MPIVKIFRRIHSNFVSSRQVVTELSNLVPGSNVEQSERSSNAPVTAKKSIRKKVAIADRRAMLESFVNKYRAINLGKFPSPTSAHKEIGGSYYIIRKMLQEMEYAFKKSPAENMPEKDNKKQIKNEDTINREITIESSGSQRESKSQINIDQQLCEDPFLESISNLDTNFRLKEEIQPSTSSADSGNSNIITDDISNIATESHDRVGQFDEKLEQNMKDDNFDFKDSESKVEKQHDEIRNITGEVAIESSGSQQESNSQLTIDQQLCENPLLESVSNSDTNFKLKVEIQPLTNSANSENSNVISDDINNIATNSHDRVGQFDEKLEQNMKDDNSTLEDSESKVEKQDDEIRNITRDIPKQQKEDELSEKQSLWGNLKSLATGFINIWKK